MQSSLSSLSHPPIDPWVGPLVQGLLRGACSSLLEPLPFHSYAGKEGCEEGGLPHQPRPKAQSARAELAESLFTFNQTMGHANAKALSDALADSATEVVVTGQQAGLFGGPIYALSKAVAATLWARRLSAAGRPTVAVFWIASEDHDFEEVRSACLGTKTLSACTQDHSTRPVGQRLVDAQLIATIEEELQCCLRGEPKVPGLEQALELARSCYLEGEPFSHGFARLLPALLGEACPLLLDSQDPVLKRSQVAPVSKLILQAKDAVRALESREQDIEDNGFKLQIPRARLSTGAYALPLFLHRGAGRCRVILNDPESAASSYSLRGHDETGSLEDLVALITESPDQMSPSALLRPVLQDAALGSTLQVLGPGEVAYIPQAAPLYRLLEVAAPTVALRPQSVFVPARSHQRYCDMLGTDGLTAKLLLGPWSTLEKLLAEIGDNGTLQELDNLDIALAKGLEKLEGKAVTLDPNLKKSLHKTRQHLERGLKNFRSRVEKTSATEAGVLRTRIDRFRDIVLPDGKLQERKLCSLWMYMQFGEGFTHQMLEQMSLDPRRLQVLPMNRTPVPHESK